MPNKLQCEIVQDLLPSYVDGLTSDVTNQAVEAHVAGCEKCRASLNAMIAPEASQQDFEEKQEIDFLKKTKKKLRRTIFGTIAVIILVVCALLFTRFYVVGSPLYGQSVACTVDVNGNMLTLNGAVVDSSLGITDIDYTEENGVVTVSFKAALASPLRSGDFTSEYVADSNITQVKIGERIVWDNGAEISSYVSAVYNTKHPYVGEMPANNETANALGISRALGGYLNSLQTTEEPYGWTLQMESDYSQKHIGEIQEKMTGYAFVLLATIDNLNVVSYEYTVDGVAETYTITSEEATAAVGKDIKLCALTPSALQELMDAWDLENYATASQSNESQSIFINLINATDQEIYDITMNYYVNEELVGGTGAAMADGSPLKKGDSIRLELNDASFMDIVLTDNSEIQVSFQVGTNPNGTYDGTGIYDVDTVLTLSSEWGYDYNYMLTGNAEDGFVLQ